MSNWSVTPLLCIRNPLTLKLWNSSIFSSICPESSLAFSLVPQGPLGILVPFHEHFPEWGSSTLQQRLLVLSLISTLSLFLNRMLSLGKGNSVLT